MFANTNDGNKRLNCFLCDFDMCVDCAGTKERLISEPEIEKAKWRKFFEETADKNHDGFLSVEEIHAAFPDHDKEWAQKLVDGIDSDHDEEEEECRKFLKMKRRQGEKEKKCRSTSKSSVLTTMMSWSGQRLEDSGNRLSEC